ncbi:hypothetical protein B0A49_02866 [Cryomyces minteri]|uniref:Nucleoporin Nup54 alpha-helical domain-containing protein n=1 Tax=Cryomyces minteri TaxID=331657 RepID=A0A4U0XM50_9PEZI|nr:hypothetical protein B0A49_02866 [Cryomyces minteri]
MARRDALVPGDIPGHAVVFSNLPGILADTYRNDSGNTTNTSQSAQTGGLFGGASTSQPHQGGGPFGSSTNQQQQGSGLFGATTNQPQQNGGIFGAAASNPQQGSGLFGSSTSNQQGTGLFGSSTQQSQPQQSGGLFGGALGQNQNQGQQQQQQSGGLFSNLGNQNQGQQQGSGLFGNVGAQNKPATSSVFGSTLNQNTQPQQQSSSLFGNLGAPKAPQQSTLFGGSTLGSSTMGGGFGGGLTMGQGTAQPQTVPGVKVDLSSIRNTTRFSDLHETVQQQIEQIDAFIQQQIAYSEQCAALMPSHQQNLASIPDDVKLLEEKVETVDLALTNDSQTIASLKKVVRADATDAQIAFRVIENLRLPSQFHYSGLSAYQQQQYQQQRSLTANSVLNGEAENTDLVGYIDKQATDMEKRLARDQSNLGAIEQHLGTVEASALQQVQQMAMPLLEGARGRLPRLHLPALPALPQLPSLPAISAGAGRLVGGIFERVGAAGAKLWGWLGLIPKWVGVTAAEEQFVVEYTRLPDAPSRPPPPPHYERYNDIPVWMRSTF